MPISSLVDPLVLDRDPNFEVTWAEDGSDMPRNWPAWYRGTVLASISFATLVVIMTSTAYSPGIPGMMDTFGIKNRTIPILGVTTYLFGLAFGPLVLAPLSEIYGRRPVYIVSLLLFSIFLVPSAMARNFETILVTRFFAAFVGSVVMSGAPGTLSDICDDETRTRYLSIWILGAVNGPVIGPIFAGIIFQYAGWRWISWWLVILAFIACALMTVVKETNGNAILRTRCELLKTVDGRFWTRAMSGASLPIGDRLRASLRQPILMIFTEPICTFWDLYVGSVYAILYLCIVGYPIVFTQIRGWSPATASLPFLSIGLGSCLTVIAEPAIRRVTRRLNTQATTSVDPTLLIILAGGILLPMGQLLFAVSAAPPNSPVVAILAGIPLGVGNMLIFLYVADYLAMTYKAHAASALAGHASTRYMGAALLPLLAPVMYGRLGALVTGLILAAGLTMLAAVPIIFIKWGLLFKEKSQLAHDSEVCKVKGCNST
ncbi:MFS general substrate transporter [Didymella exigua CBS 183.55]|uniref:MFS general substrate transporter n=1 Tax=Didymella exigua CBS 183.55 TaxID=1150837 RepID=A0A6A5RHB5_9PLEO|nr:MFS general substrate transporter [Didymella exigua CBS 183.55]KAF1924997.1 MFS general substrate transporter [Didymella exigua CBS 183.55]